MRRSLTKREILRKKEDLERLFEKGKVVNSKHFRVIGLENGLGYDRFIVITVKHFGSSVERNRARRRAKEAFRTYSGRLEEGEMGKSYDFALILYSKKAATFEEIKNQLESALISYEREV